MITVFTPTYNRANTLDRLYQSLLRQRDKNFEWLVIDDGSTDNTQEYFENITKTHNGFDIRYFKMENGGKHRAINRGVELAKGEAFFIVDSDDYLTDDAIEKVETWIRSLDNSKKWAGVSGEKAEVLSENNVQGKYIDAKNNERYKYGLLSDKAEVYFTDIMKKYQFPQFEDEKFLLEATVWDAIAIDGYYVRWYSDVIYICEYMPGGLTDTASKNYAANPKGLLCWAKTELRAYKHNLRIRGSVITRYYNAVKDKKSKQEAARDLGVSSISLKIYLLAKRVKDLVRK